MPKIFKNWDLRRFMYLLIGLFFIVTALMDKVWWLSIFGFYLVIMAIFRLGCAKGNCGIEVKKQQH